jgi:hypothetical protein
MMGWKKLAFSLLINLFIVAQSFCQEKKHQVNVKPFKIGETISLNSTVLGEERVINVYLPSSYGIEKDKKYPVIYLLDGSADEDFIHIAGIVQFGSFSWINMLPESIVVGIANVDRKRDFTYPTKNVQDKIDFPTTGGSTKFIDFIQSELKPYINDHYHVGGTSTIIGQSLGGLLATEILLSKPELFDHFIIISSSLWWDDESLLNKTIDVSLENKSVYIGVGKEGEIMERCASSLFDKLSKHQNIQAKLYFQFFEKMTHGDVLHIAVYDAFSKIFATEKDK